MASSSATMGPDLQTGGQSEFLFDELKFTDNFKNLPVGAWGRGFTFDKTGSDIIQLLAVLRSCAPGSVLAYGFRPGPGPNAAATQSDYSKAAAPLQSGTWVATMLSYDLEDAKKVLKASVCSSKPLASATDTKKRDEHLCRSLKAFHLFPVEGNKPSQGTCTIPDMSKVSLDSLKSVEDKSLSQELCIMLLANSAQVSARIAESLARTEIDGPQSLTQNMKVEAKQYKGQAYWNFYGRVLVPEDLDKEDPRWAKPLFAIQTSLFKQSSR